MTKKYCYKRTMKRIIKVVQYYIDNPDTVSFVSFVGVNPITGEVRLNDFESDGSFLTYNLMFFTKTDGKSQKCPDLRHIEHWVLTDLRRFAQRAAS